MKKRNGGLFMGLFGKKKAKVDLDQEFKDKYKQLNQTVRDANNEADLEIQISLLELADKNYDDLLALIDQGAKFEKEHFIALQKQIALFKGLSDEN